MELIYKYRRLFDDKNNLLKNTLQLIINGELYLSDPSLFNDPFDSIFQYTFRGNEKEIESHLQKRGLIGEKLKKQMKVYTSHPEVIEELFDEILRDRKSNYRVCCFSRRNNSMLMWSHYADYHKGVCVGIKKHSKDDSKPYIRVKSNQFYSIEDSKTGVAFPIGDVRYCIKRPKRLNGLHQPSEQTADFLFTKYKDWSYEEEVRIVSHKDEIKNNPIYMAQDQIGEVIFGAKVPDRIIERTMASISNPDMEYYKMKLSNTRYELVKIRI